jgi:adenylyltransferase/sulfurtransferase
MSKDLNKNEIERFSRQIILKNVGSLGQKKIKKARILIIGAGGLGCPAAEFLTRAGVGYLGIIDNDVVNISNIHRQSLYDISDINKSKVRSAKKKLNKINPKTIIRTYSFRLNKDNAAKIIKDYDYIVDGSDNFKTKFLVNENALKFKKFLVVGAISKFDGHLFTYDFSNKKTPCLRCFFQNDKV